MTQDDEQREQLKAMSQAFFAAVFQPSVADPRPKPPPMRTEYFDAPKTDGQPLRWVGGWSAEKEDAARKAYGLPPRSPPPSS